MKFSIRPDELIFLCAGIFMLISVPFLEAAGFLLWISVKAVYFAGLFFVTLYVWNRDN